VIQVTKLVRVVLGVQDLDRSTAFYTDDWGLGITEEAPDTIYLRTTAGEHHSVGLVHDRDGGMREVGFEVGAADDLDRAAEDLARAGVTVEKAPGPADRPGARRNMRFRDPDDRLVELSWGPEEVRDAYGTRNVKPLDLNHVVLRTTDIDRAHRFYIDHFGFRESDWNQHRMVFLRCNEIHHQLAFVRRDQAGLDHVAFELRDFLEISKGVYHLGQRGVPRIWGPGRHGAGNNLFSYFWDPDRHIVEYTSDIIRIENESAWTPRVWPAKDETPDLWRQPAPPAMRD